MAESRITDKIELIKYLHKPHTMTQIENDNAISERTRQYWLAEDIQIGNVTIPMQLTKVETNTRGTYISDAGKENNLPSADPLYRSSTHPVILPLNLTEVYALTNHLLDKCDRSSPDYAIYREIAEKIYSQLSDYALAQLRENRHHLEKRNTVTYISEQEFFDKHMRSEFLYCLKSGDPVKVTFEKEEIITGQVRLNFDEDKYYLESNGKKYPLDGSEKEILSIEILPR